MYVVTFYSFKGGVGRTMALVNTAFALAKRNKRVLIVDFDLEAPGLATYLQFSAAADAEGLVDYVVRYRDTGQAPDVMQYIVQCSTKDGPPSLPLYVMPAGKRGKGYRTKLHSMDWPRLYSDHDGYLMFEDMKQQWEEVGQFDYVLIDSRTGHTDIGGICTRHLPDVVVLMFFPNKENIDGLKVVVDELRQQAQMNEARQQSGGPKRPIRRPRLLFCPSNVPVLDDEENILGDQMAEAGRALRYAELEEPVVIIRHYESLDLVRQTVFVIDRSNTRLARDYHNLVGTIVKGNVEDRVGALATIEDGLRRLRTRRRSVARDADTSEPFLSDIAEIERIHRNDGEIAFRLASIYRFHGNLSSEEEALTIAIKERHEMIEALRLRATNLANQNKKEAALNDLRAVVNSDEAGPFEIAATFEPLRRLVREKWIEVVANATAIRSLSVEQLVPVVDQLPVDVKGAHLAAELIRDQWTNRGNLRSPIRKVLESLYVLSLIGSGQFAEAKRAIAEDYPGQDVAEWDDMADVFNYAMADWGERQRPPVEALRKMLALDAIKENRRPGANYQQCIAIAHAALGNRQECEERVRAAQQELGPGAVFSAWQYLKVSRYKMMEDLLVIERGCQTGKAPQPPFSRRQQKLSSVE